MATVERIFRMFRHGDIPGLTEITGLQRSTIYKKIKEGTFPAGIKIGPRARGWTESQIREWRNGLEATDQRNKTAHFLTENDGNSNDICT